MGPLFLGTVKALILAQAMQGTIVGRVWDAETAKPVAGAVVTMADLNRAAGTDDGGRYVLRAIPAGEHQITVRFIGYAQRSIHALVPRKGQLEIDVWLLPEPIRINRVDVRAPVIVPGLDAGDPHAAFPDREISAAAMRNHPLLAEPDALEALGGGEVFMRPESPSGVNIRGGASDQTAYLLDGIPILNPYHAAGISSGWNPDALSRLRLESAAPGSHPNSLAGVIEASTRKPGDRIRGHGSVSTTQSRVTFDGPLGATGAGYLVSMRTGLPGAIAPKGEASYIKGETGDWLAKLESPAFGGRLQFLGYGNENELNTAAVVAAEDGTTPDPRRNAFEWVSRSLGAQWKRTFSNTSVQIVGWRADGDAGSIWASQSGPVDMAATRRDTGLRAGVQHNSHRAFTGAEVRIEQSRTRYRIESDSMPGAPGTMASWTIAANAPVATVIARHGRTVFRRLEIDLATALAATGGKQHIAPSARLVWSASSRLQLSGSYTRAHQFAQSLRNAESVVGNVFPVDVTIGAGALAEDAFGALGAPGVPVARSQLGVIAASYRPSAGLKIGVQAYTRASEGLLLVAPREGEPFATAADAFVIGSGRSRGVSADAALSAKRYGVVLSYGLQDSRLSYGSSSYVPEHGATHFLQSGLIVFPSATTSVRIGLTAAMGRRATGLAGDFEWEATNLLDRGSEFGGSPHLGGQTLGATTLPDYYRLDLGFRKQWRVGAGGDGATVALFATATNLLGRKNLLNYATDPSIGELTGIEMRPRAPLVVGLDWGF